MPNPKSRTIKEISYLNEEGVRETAKIGVTGRIDFGKYKPVLPHDFVKLFFVQGGDPVLTLVDGDKLRVYYGGDPTQYSVQASGVLDNHNEYYHALYSASPKDTLEVPFDWVWGGDTDF